MKVMKKPLEKAIPRRFSGSIAKYIHLGLFGIFFVGAPEGIPKKVPGGMSVVILVINFIGNFIELLKGRRIF